VEKDTKNNVVFVSRNYFSVDKRRRLFRVGSLKWLIGAPPTEISQLQCKVFNSVFTSQLCVGRPLVRGSVGKLAIHPIGIIEV